MRLYSLNGATAVDHGGEHYEPGKDGGFDFPNELSGQLHGFAVGGKRLWETDIERQDRLAREELARRQSPEALYEAVQQLVRAGQESATPAPAKAPGRRAAASK